MALPLRERVKCPRAASRDLLHSLDRVATSNSSWSCPGRSSSPSGACSSSPRPRCPGASGPARRTYREGSYSSFGTPENFTNTGEPNVVVKYVNTHYTTLLVRMHAREGLADLSYVALREYLRITNGGQTRVRRIHATFRPYDTSTSLARHFSRCKSLLIIGQT